MKDVASTRTPGSINVLALAGGETGLTGLSIGEDINIAAKLPFWQTGGKFYGSMRLLQGVNLRVNAGEVTCVMGDNGAGKSTLIKIRSGRRVILKLASGCWTRSERRSLWKSSPPRWQAERAFRVA
jgi:hypothetical protein